MKTTDPLEKDIEAAVVKHAKSLGMLVYKFTSPSRRSVPDRMFITQAGVVFFIEMKRRGEKPTTAQALEIAKIRAQGVKCFVVDNVADGKKVVGWMDNSSTTQKLVDALKEVVECCESTDDYSSSALLGASIVLKEVAPDMSDPAF